MNTKTKLLGLALAVGLSALSSCRESQVIYTGGGGGGGGGTPQNIWFDLYGNGCSTGNPRPGCNFYWYSGKLVKIMDFEDPYYQSSYQLVSGFYTYYLNGVKYSYNGPAWFSSTGILYDAYGNALNQKKKQGRDIAINYAKQENAVVEKAGRDFAAKYSLDVAKGIQIAKAVNAYAKIGMSRVRTEADMAEFSKKVYGVDYNQIKSALLESAKGNKALIKASVAQAAKSWGTSEENMHEILLKHYGSAVAF